MNYIATIGNFDGIHIGHQMLIQNVLMQAEEKNLRSLLYTFNVHTKGSQELILNPKDKVLFLQQMGLEKVQLLDFESIRKMTPREFVFHLSEQKIKELIVGEDFRFGVHASGDAEILKELCAQQDITVMIFPSVYIGNEKISSTYLRKELKVGKLEKVNPFLYQNFFITSKIVGGYQRGSKIGFKTANTPWPSGVVIPKYGVYSTRVFLEGNEYDALTMVGIPYTFHEDRFTVETHIFNFNRDIYGENIQIEFLEYIRENRKFRDLEELRSQLLLDKLEAMKIRSK